LDGTSAGSTRTPRWRSQLSGNELTGKYSGPEVGFEEIAIDVLQARFRVADYPEITPGDYPAR
jgi:hypothetical protein